MFEQGNAATECNIVMFICILEMVNVLLNRQGARPPHEKVEHPPRAFDGVKRDGPAIRQASGRDFAAALALRGEVAYWIGAPHGPEREPMRRPEMRGERRERMRLRSAKLLDATYSFLCECRIYDRSLNGLRVLLGRNIGLPGRFAVHVDETCEVRRARMIWRRGLVLGVRLYEPAPNSSLSLSERFALRERYYGIPD